MLSNISKAIVIAGLTFNSLAFAETHSNAAVKAQEMKIAELQNRVAALNDDYTKLQKVTALLSQATEEAGGWQVLVNKSEDVAAWSFGVATTTALTRYGLTFIPSTRLAINGAGPTMAFVKISSALFVLGTVSSAGAHYKLSISKGHMAQAQIEIEQIKLSMQAERDAIARLSTGLGADISAKIIDGFPQGLKQLINGGSSLNVNRALIAD